MEELKNIFDLLKDVSNEKRDLWSEQPEAASRLWKRYIVDSLLSQHLDCILIINELNCRPNLPTRWHHDYLLRRLPAKKRYSKLVKPEIAETVEVIQDVYGYSISKAMEVLDLIRPEDLQRLQESRNVGGAIKKKKGHA